MESIIFGETFQQGLDFLSTVSQCEFTSDKDVEAVDAKAAEIAKALADMWLSRAAAFLVDELTDQQLAAELREAEGV